MLWCCIDMRLADQRREHPLMFNGCLGGYSKSLPPSGVIPTSLARVPGRPQKLLGCEFRVSPSDLLCGVSLPGDGTGAVGVDERVEGASRTSTGFVLLDVDQVERAAPIRPLVEPHGGVASFDDPYQASYEVEAVRKVIPLAVSCSVYFHGHWLVHAFSPRREGLAGTEGGKPRPNPAVSQSLTPRVSEAVKRRRTLR